MRVFFFGGESEVKLRGNRSGTSAVLTDPYCDFLTTFLIKRQ